MNLELLKVLSDIFIFSCILYALSSLVMKLLKQYYVRKLCRYRGTGEKPGRACVICAYHHQCDRAKQSGEYKQYSYYRRVLPDHAKELLDEIWEEEEAKQSNGKPE